MADTYKLPIFATATLSNLQPAIDVGIIDTFAYIYLKDSGKLAFVDQNLNVHIIQSDCPEYIKKVDSLDPEYGNETTLYLMNGVYYSFDGEKYEPLFKNIDDKIDVINNALLSISDYMNLNDDNIEGITQDIADIKSDIEGLEENITAKFNESVQESKAYINSVMRVIEFRGSEVDDEL